MEPDHTLPTPTSTNPVETQPLERACALSKLSPERHTCSAVESDACHTRNTSHGVRRALLWLLRAQHDDHDAEGDWAETSGEVAPHKTQRMQMGSYSRDVSGGAPQIVGARDPDSGRSRIFTVYHPSPDAPSRADASSDSDPDPEPPPAGPARSGPVARLRNHVEEEPADWPHTRAA